MTSRIHCVDQVDLALVGASPPQLVVSFRGRVAGVGWTNVRLALVARSELPSDGILECEAVGEATAGHAIMLPVIATLVLDDADVPNFWAQGVPLQAVRCHAAANHKTALLRENRPGMSGPRRVALDTAAAAGTPSFATDIRPLFRTLDVNAMKAIGNFDLSLHADVVTHADRILASLKDKRMPCDGPWPDGDIGLFERWIEAGTPA